MYKFAPYSYSKISCYKECPKKFKFNYIDKMYKFEDAPHFEKGKFFHYVMEHYPHIPPKKFKFRHFGETQQTEMVDKIKDLLTNDTRLIDLLTKYKLKAEHTFYIGENFNVMSKKKNSLIYGVIDYIGKKDDEVLIVDWKTGKSEASFDQLQMYAIWAFLAMPNINKVRIALYYLEQDRVDEELVERVSLENLLLKYINIINSIETDTNFEKKKSNKCEWCIYFNECTKGDIKIWKNT